MHFNDKNGNRCLDIKLVKKGVNIVLINTKLLERSNVEFISYDGKYPCLCSGKLILRIDGVIVTFGSL